jgi:hypothetical protein
MNDLFKKEKSLRFINEVLSLTNQSISKELLQAKTISFQAITNEDLLKIKTKA